MDTYGADYAALAGVSAVFWIIYLAVIVFYVFVMWKIFVKAGEPGWASIVPFYNTYVLFKITWGNGWLFLLSLIPFVNVVILIITFVKLAQAFGKGGGFAAGLILLSFIFLPILAFDSSDYIGPQN